MNNYSLKIIHVKCLNKILVRIMHVLDHFLFLNLLSFFNNCLKYPIGFINIIQLDIISKLIKYSLNRAQFEALNRPFNLRNDSEHIFIQNITKMYLTIFTKHRYLIQIPFQLIFIDQQANKTLIIDILNRPF